MARRQNRTNGQLSTARPLQQQRGRRGGRAATEAKAAAARANGSKGGRPPAAHTAAADEVTERWRLSEAERRQVLYVLRRGADLLSMEWDALGATVQAAADEAKRIVRGAL